MKSAAGASTMAFAPKGGGVSRRAIGLITRVNSAAAVLAATLLWMLAILIFGDIVLRMLHMPILWSNEVSVYLLIALVYLGIGYTYDCDGHFTIQLLVERLPRKWRLGVELWTVLVCLSFAVFLTLGGIGLVQFARSLSIASPTLLHVPLSIPYSCVIIGGVSLALSLLVRALNLIDAMRRGADVSHRTEHSI
jgi:TRAP-type C4-dicarboxylate transport system permease small subunit